MVLLKLTVVGEHFVVQNVPEELVYFRNPLLQAVQKFAPRSQLMHPVIQATQVWTPFTIDRTVA